MPLYEVLAYPRPSYEEVHAEIQREFERLPKEQRTLHKWLEVARRKLAEVGVPHVYARVHARDAEEARKYAEATLVAAAADQLPRAELPPEEERFFGPRYLVDSIVYPFAEEVIVDPPPEGGPSASDLLVLGAAVILGATALWVTALLSRAR